MGPTDQTPSICRESQKASSSPSASRNARAADKWAAIAEKSETLIYGVRTVEELGMASRDDLARSNEHSPGTPLDWHSKWSEQRKRKVVLPRKWSHERLR